MTAQQTHEKNLAWIDERIKALSYNGVAQILKDSLNSLRANRKVLERHRPKEGGDWTFCGEDGVGYPCPTTTDITEGLGISG